MVSKIRDCMNVVPDTWLTEVFGYEVFRIEGIAEGEGPMVRSHMHSFSRAFYFAKIPTSDIGCVRELLSVGMYPVDVNVTLTWDRERTVLPGPVQDVLDQPRIFDEAVMAIAESCFVYSRFHLDPQIPHEVAGRVKREWAASYLGEKPRGRLFVAVRGDQAAGFLAAIIFQRPEGAVAVIELLGVHPTFQRQGIGASLVSAFLCRAHAEVVRLQVGTQAANIASLLLYERMGFRVSDTTYVLHGHV